MTAAFAEERTSNGPTILALPINILLDDRISHLAARVYLLISSAEDLAGRAPDAWRMIDILNCTKAAYRKALTELTDAGWAVLEDDGDVLTAYWPSYNTPPVSLLGSRP